ncbi:hypothetical protein [Nocardia sp. BMG111209]|uniref:hypothetical protein n=1 Tax=Nocardia sp. BMG111209 TaxID=1160137 RepID=UPI000380820A|nr:hypothetical protein [Nocardia sp. BMG111209]
MTAVVGVQEVLDWFGCSVGHSGRPRLLDLYCASGGAAVGYHRAGFEVVGVDICDQPDYPFEFHRGDALDYLTTHGHEFAAVHASPPCQASSALTAGTNQALAGRYPQLIPATRAALIGSGRPWVMENVQGAKLRRDVVLCGEMFGLNVIRHRVFELGGWTAAQPLHLRHRGRVAGYRHGDRFDGPYVAVYGSGGGKGSVSDWQAAMGIDWTSNRRSLAEAIPPAYTQFLGAHLLRHLDPDVEVPAA